MGVFFKSWGLDGTLYADNFSTFHSNGLAGNPITVHGIGPDGNDHCSRISLEGGQALLMKVLRSDAITSNGHRTEMIPATASYNGITDYVGIADWGGSYATQERWYRFQFKIPELNTEFLRNSSNFMVIAQLHQSPDTSPADTVSNPPIAIHVTYNSIQIMNIASSAEVTTNANKVTKVLYEIPLVFDTWVDILINVQWSWTNLGHITIWHDRERVYKDFGVMNCPNNDVARGSAGNYAKFGIYTTYPLGNYTDQDLHVYHRGIIVGDASTSFAQMYPELSNPVEYQPKIFKNAFVPYIG